MEILAQAQESAGEGSERAARAQGERRRAPESAGERRESAGRAQKSAGERKGAQDSAGERSRRAQQESTGERRRAQKRAYTKKLVLEPPKSETFTGICKFHYSQSL